MSYSTIWRGLSSVISTVGRPSYASAATPRLTATPAPASLSISQPSWFGTILGSRLKHSFKTNRSAFKRFRVRGNGSLKRNKAGKSHNSGHKGRARVTKLGQSTGISNRKIEMRMKKLTGLG